MEIVIVPSPEDGGRIAADIVCGAIENGARTLGLATGSSPLHTYRELIKRHRESGVSFAAMSAYLLDEYVGLTPDQPQSYAHTIRTELVDHLDIARAARNDDAIGARIHRELNRNDRSAFAA